MRILLIMTALTIALASFAYCEEDSFKDVPKDHWAAEFVQIVKADRVMKGYPDATFKGDKAVTRYELAVALERMIAFIEQGLKPEAQRQKGAESGEPRAKSPEATSPQLSPQGERASAAHTLKAGGYIAANSPLLTNQQEAVSPTELAQALSSVAAKLIEKTIPPPKE